MKTVYNRFLVRLILFSLILGIATLLAWYLLPKAYVSPVLPFLIPFFFSLSVLIHYFLLKGIEKKFASFVNRYMLMTLLKLFVLIAVILVYVLSNKQDAVPFMVAFFIYYLCYTIFEVASILRLPK